MNPTATLFDGTARLYREAQARSEWRGVERQHVAVGNAFPCAAQVRRRNRADLGPGESEVGEWYVYAPMSAVEPATGDVIRILTGPEAGKTLRVEDNYTPRGRFRQTRCRQWDGAL